jgi:site-specific recombinase XerD
MAERLDDLVASWQRHLRAADKAPRTVELYTQSVRFYCRWLADHGREQTLDELTRSAIVAWLGGLADAGRSTNTLSTRFRGLRRFCRWLVAEGILDTSPMDGMEQPKATPKPVPVLTDDDVVALLKSCTGTTFADRRDQAILRVLFDCGVRISECARLTLADVDFDLEVLRVVGKGRKVRVVPFGAKTARTGTALRPSQTRCGCRSGARCRLTGWTSGYGYALARPAWRGCTRTGSATPPPTPGCGPVGASRTSSG